MVSEGETQTRLWPFFENPQAKLPPQLKVTAKTL
jgi:hypothetical protein